MASPDPPDVKPSVASDSTLHEQLHPGGDNPGSASHADHERGRPAHVTSPSYSHTPAVERFEPKEETWLLDEDAKPFLPPSVENQPEHTTDTEEETLGSHRQAMAQTPAQPAYKSPYADSGSKVVGETKCAYCVGIAIHAPHLLDLNKCTCPTRSSRANGLTTGDQRTTTAATGSGPRYDPSQLLKRAGLVSEPRVPINFPFTAGTGNSSSNGKAPADRTSPPPSRPSGVGADRLMYTFNHPVPSITDGEEDGQINLDYPAQPRSAAWESDLDMVVDDADDDRPANAAVPSANVNTSGSRKRRRTNTAHPRRSSQPATQPRRRQARSPPPSPSLSPPPAAARFYRPITHEADMIGHRPEDIREDERLIALQVSALDLLERSHDSLRDYLSSYFDTNRRLKTDLQAARRAEGRAELRLAEAERLCIRYRRELEHGE